MATDISDDQAYEAIDRGVKIGGTEPCRESKGSWWSVVVYQGKIYACAIWPGQGASGGEEITADELPLYCDDPDAARKVLAMELERTGHATV